MFDEWETYNDSGRVEYVSKSDVIKSGLNEYLNSKSRSILGWVTLTCLINTPPIS